MLSAPRRSCARVRQARSKELQREIEFLRELNNSLLKNQKTLQVGLPRPSVATARICGCVSPHPFNAAPRAIMPPLRQPQAAAPYSAIAEVLRARRIPVRM